MTKAEKLSHEQKKINLYNHQLQEIERKIRNEDLTDYEVDLLLKRMDRLVRRLVKLYRTEKYGMV